MLKAFKKIRTDSGNLDEVQENIEDVLTPFIRSQIIDGVLIRDISLSSGIDNKVNHKLGRKPTGWLLVRKRAQGDVWDLQDSNRTPSKTLVLRSSTNIVVDLWIF
jgi:hypothetical protein